MESANTPNAEQEQQQPQKQPPPPQQQQVERKRSLERVSSYNNRYARSPSLEAAARLPSVTEDPSALPPQAEEKLKKERRMSAQSRRAHFQRLTSQTRSSVDSDPGHPPLSFRTSIDSCAGDGDVFVDVGGAGVEKDTRSLEKKISVTSIASSTMPILPNPHNTVNHSIHDCFWCCYCFYFAFFCCLPAVRLMESSDAAFAAGEEEKARKYGRLSTVMFVVGALLTLALFAGILFLVIYFTAFNK